MRAEAKVRGLESMAKTEDAECGGDHHRHHRWGTWEELLLACAVNRHGTKSWESVAVEVQSRTSSPLLLNAQNCRQKYHDLKRQFSAADPKSNGGDADSARGDEATIPLLEELRKLRVAELRREVQRSDLSIVSLQQKVKKLEEERERSVTEKERGVERSDLEKGRGEGDGEEEKNGGSEKSTPENGAEKHAGGEESDRENRSFNESNSTETKGKNDDVRVEPKAKSEEPAGAAGGGNQAPAPVKPVGGEGSYNGSSDTAAGPPAATPGGGELGEFRESVAESKGGGGEEGAKESSDVQSSASLSRQRRRKAVSGSSSGDDASPETEALSPAAKRVAAKSQRLDRLGRVMEAVRSHKHGSVFERRLESQETPVYQKLIRQHLDLDTIKTKLDEGLYSDSSLEFFRDLLLLFNNALVFFPKNSPESLAAAELRHLVSKDIASSRPTPPPRPKPKAKPKPLLTTLKPPQPAPPLLSKKPPSLPPQPQPPPKPASNLNETAAPSRPLVACRKRSPFSAKPSKPVLPEMKPAPERIEPEEPPAAPSKQRTRERSASRTRAARGNKGSGGGGGGGNKLGLLSESSPEPKVENAVTKKPGAAGFLNRMKRSSPSLLDSLKESTNQNSTGNRGRGEQKKGATKREQGGGRSHGSSSRQAQEHSSQGRRSVGRPPKRATGPASAASRKVREAADANAKPPRKRAKR